MNYYGKNLALLVLLTATNVIWGDTAVDAVKNISSLNSSSNSSIGVPHRGSLKVVHLPKECGKTRFDTSKRIVMGDKAKLGQFPWMARLGMYLRRSKETIYICGGSLINRYYVISAAHCENQTTTVRLGENYLKHDIDCDETGDCAPPHQDIQIKRHIFSSFCSTTLTDDFVLIEMEKPAELNDFVQPICLPHSPMSHQEFMGKTMTIQGWGLINSRPKEFPEYLMYIKAPVVNPENCYTLFHKNLTEKQWCIGYDKGKDSCNGDSGGPATISMEVNGERRNYLAGLVSFGLPICGYGEAVYTDVSKYLGFAMLHIQRS